MGDRNKAVPFLFNLKTTRKKSSHHTDDSNEGGCLFGSMMCMMMHQSRIESEQREHQNKQREHQHIIDAEQRERKYELRHEKMAIACKEACTQRQLMNVMTMSFLNKNGGENIPCPP